MIRLSKETLAFQRGTVRAALLATGGQTGLMRSVVRAAMLADGVSVVDKGLHYHLTLLGRRASSTISPDMAISNWAFAVIDKDAPQ